MKRITALVLAAGLAANGWGEPKTGAAFLRINPSVRGEALGGMNPVSAFGAAGMTVNPAALALMEGHEFASGFASLLGDSQYGTVGVGLKRGAGGGVGASGTFLRSGPLEGRDASGNATAAFNAQDLSAGVTGALSLGENLHAGATAKAVRQEIGNVKSNTAAAGDVGAIWETGSVVWGAAALNLGGKVKFQGKESALPAVYSLGASVPLGGGLAVLGGVSRGSGETTANMGVEYRLGPASLRMGYRSDGGSSLAKGSQKGSAQALGGLTGGIGITVSNLRIDYAVSQTAVEWGMGHRASVTWKWGGEEPARRREVREDRRTSAATPAAKKAAPAKSPRPTYKPAPKTGSGVTTGSRRAYDPAPVVKKKLKKRWVD